MINFAFDLIDVYKTYFQPPYTINNTQQPAEVIEYGSIPTKKWNNKTVLGSDLSYKSELLGREVFLPVELYVSEDLRLKLDCCSIRVSCKKTIIRTALSERKGTVKEQWNIDDYKFTFKGVLIGATGTFPDDQMLKLKQIFESDKPVELRNAIAELFLDKSNKIAIEDLDYPEKTGGSLRHVPFTFNGESDFIDSLKIK